MDVTISITPSTVKLGNPVTITYTATECADVTLNIPNFPNPIDLGGGEYISGSMQVLPLTDGGFDVQIVGSGRFGFSNDYMPEITQTAGCTVT